MRNQLIIGILALTLCGCSLNRIVQPGGDWSGYDYSYFCPAYTFSDQGQSSAKLNILDANHLVLADSEYVDALATANEYIAQRGGTDFFSKVNFYDIDITYLDSSIHFSRKRPLFNLDKCGETKYFVRYLFRPRKNVEYRFGIAMSADFEILSDSQFPNHDTNTNFTDIITSTEALRIAQKDKDVRTIRVIEAELDYRKSDNCFVWTIESSVKSSSKSDFEEHRVLLTINAVSGAKIERKDLIRQSSHNDSLF